jgi:hypothetical protein
MAEDWKYMKKGRPSKWIELSDRDYLYDLYLVQNQSTSKIANKIGCDAKSVNWALKKFGIEIRDLSESHCVGRSELKFDLEVLQGSLLGDGSLLKKNRKSLLCRSAFSKTNKYRDHLALVARSIYGEKSEPRIKEAYKTLNGKKFRLYRFTTLHHKEFDIICNDWYPASNNFKKVVPETLEITPKILLHWFLDDGCAPKKRKGIQLCSDGFTKLENQSLADQLTKKYNLDAWLISNGKGSHRIKIGIKKMGDFYEVVGKCPVPSLSYKWLHA